MKPQDPSLVRSPQRSLPLGYPIWWHHHGDKIRVREVNDNSIRLAGSAAELTITRGNENEWVVAWKVVRRFGSEEAAGQVVMSTDELGAAFDLNKLTGDYGDFLLDRFGGTSAEQGYFIRYQDFLNIPCPGTGHDGDPNISILLDQEIKQSVRELLGDS